MRPDNQLLKTASQRPEGRIDIAACIALGALLGLIFSAFI
jgi:hypothetical protein